MSKKTPVVIGNWKLNPNSELEAVALASALTKKQKKRTDVTMAVAPSFVHLSQIKKVLAKSPIAVAAQDVSAEPLGPFTGEVSVSQLKDLDVQYVIIGHSERRAMGESSEQVQKKVVATLKAKLTPVVCIGELERDAQGAFYSFVEAQIRSLVSVLDKNSIKKIIIAYEPVWAIGTGKTATKEDVKEMQLFIFSTLVKLFDRATAQKVTLLYGGSVKATNAVELHKEGGMDGFLVGGASLKAEEFNAIIELTASV